MMDDVDFGAKTMRQFFGGLRLEGDESVCQLQRRLGVLVCVDVSVDVGSGQCEDEGTVGVVITIPDHSIVAEFGVEGN